SPPAPRALWWVLLAGGLSASQAAGPGGQTRRTRSDSMRRLPPGYDPVVAWAVREAAALAFSVWFACPAVGPAGRWTVGASRRRGGGAKRDECAKPLCNVARTVREAVAP